MASLKVWACRTVSLIGNTRSDGETCLWLVFNFYEPLIDIDEHVDVRGIVVEIVIEVVTFTFEFDEKGATAIEYV